MLAAAARGCHALQHVRGISNNARIIRQRTMVKMKRGLERLPSQGPDPAAAFKHGWRLAASAVLERYPVVIPEPDPFESEYQIGRFLDQQSKARPAPLEWFLTEKDRLLGNKTPTLDDPRAEMYEPAPRITEADKTNDVRSLNRALDQRLYFVVKRTPGAAHWQFPQVLATDPQVSMRDYTKKALHSVVPAVARPEVHYISFVPTCHLEHVFSPQYQAKHDVYGIKIFFYRIMLVKGDIKAITQATDYNWATEKELETLFSADYYKAIKPLLFGVGPV